MIEQLRIKNFKSIKDLELSCKKLNVLIGEPNSGKSNIIEALCLQSQNGLSQELNKQMFRYKNIGQLFYDFDINKPIVVNTGEISTVLKYAIRDNGAIENQFAFLFHPSRPTFHQLILKDCFFLLLQHQIYLLIFLLRHHNPE